MQRPILMALTLLAAGTLLADEPTVVSFKTKVHGLPPNTRIVVEMRAKFSVIDFSKLLGRKKGAGPAEPDELYAVLSEDIFRWDFTTDERGTAPARQFRFRFAKELGPVPEGLDAMLSFPTNYQIMCPEGACRSRHGSPEFGSAFDRKQLQRCLEIDYGTGVGIGVNKDCGGFKGKQYTRRPSR